MLHAPVSFLLHATVDRRFLQKCLRQLRVSYSGTKNIAKGVGLQFPFVYLSNKEGTWSHHICREGWRCFKMRTKPFGQRNGLRGTADRWSSAQGGQKCSETELEIFRNGKKVDKLKFLCVFSIVFFTAPKNPIEILNQSTTRHLPGSGTGLD